jgi:plastocyanin
MRRWPFAVSFVLALICGHSALAADHFVRVGADGTQTFSPQTLTIRAGDTVTWVSNASPTAHNVVSDGGLFTTGAPLSGSWSYSFTFTTTGTFPYYCLPHGGPGGTGQSGAIVVLDAIEVAHGSDVVDDLNAVPDRYRIGQRPYASYEAVVDVVAGNPLLQLDRTNAAGSSLQAGAAVTASVDHTQSLRWQNTAATALDTERIRVSCPSNCSGNDRYRLRAYETTYAVPRFNNSGTQVTVLLIQNPTDAAVTGTIYFWSAAGVLLNGSGTVFNLGARAALVLPTQTVSGVTGQSGTITIAHTARYGELAAKAVALEPATGFSFDTPAQWRPR